MNPKDLANESFHLRRKGDENLLGPFLGTYNARKGEVLLFEAPPNAAQRGFELLRVLQGTEPQVLAISEAGYQRGVGSIPDHHVIQTRMAKDVAPAVSIGNVQGGVQIGDHNTQNFVTVVEDLIQRFDSVASDESCSLVIVLNGDGAGTTRRAQPLDGDRAAAGAHIP